MKAKNKKNISTDSILAAKEAIKVENLNVTYFKGKPNQVNALTDINLKIYPGEFIVFFGPSGCGKSTLLYAIAGLERNITGNVFVNGKNLTKFSEKDFDNHRRFTAGMIFQAYHLINSLNVFSNIILPQFATNQSRKEREAKALELLKFFGVLEQRKKFPNELSGGQQQRVAICRSLMNDPQMILADEPTGNLDSKSAVSVMDTLADLNEKQKKTIILVTHSPTGLDYAHRIFYIKDGKLVDEKQNRKLGVKLNRSALPEDFLGADLEAGYTPSHGSAKDEKEMIEMEFLSQVKAKEIVLEALSNIDSKGFDQLEKMVAQMIVRGKRQKVNLRQFLYNNWESGGLNMDKRTAKKLSSRLEQLIIESKASTGPQASTDKMQLRRIKHDLLLSCAMKLDEKQKVLFDELLLRRLAREIDAAELYYILINRRKSGGLDLSPSLARKIVRRVELLILEKL